MDNVYTLKLKKVTLIIFCLIAFLGRFSTNLCADNLSVKNYTIGPEDKLDIKVWDNDDLNRSVEVSQKGAFTFPLIGMVKASGLTVYELEALITKKLADGYLVAPQVTASVVQYNNRKVFIFGEVRSPGSYVIQRKTHIMELISKAGGFTDKASRTIKIVRYILSHQGKEFVSASGKKEHEVFTLDLNKFEHGNTQETFTIIRGDHIYVEEELRFYVIGQVGKKGEFKWEKGMTVRLALSQAGGATQMAAEKRIRIIRVKNGKEEEFSVRMDDLVMPDDIIKVPERLF